MDDAFLTRPVWLISVRHISHALHVIDIYPIRNLWLFILAYGVTGEKSVVIPTGILYTVYGSDVMDHRVGRAIGPIRREVVC